MQHLRSLVAWPFAIIDLIIPASNYRRIIVIAQGNKPSVKQNRAYYRVLVLAGNVQFFSFAACRQKLYTPDEMTLSLGYEIYDKVVEPNRIVQFGPFRQ